MLFHSDPKLLKFFRVRPHSLFRLATIVATISMLSACATHTTTPEPAEVEELVIQTQSIEDVSVSVGILTGDQAIAQFGADLSDEDLQAVWLRIDNQSDQKLWLLVAALDPHYYSADEAAFLFRDETNDEELDELRQRFRNLSIRYLLPANDVNEGFLLVPLAEGGRYVNVQLAGHERLLKFGFAVPLPDGDFDYERLHPEEIYAGQELPDLEIDQFREWLEALPCCTADSDGDEGGDPLNLAIIGEPDDLLTALSRSGWSFTHRITLRTIQRVIGSAISGDEYPVAPVSALYTFDRKQDIALQRARTTIAQRNHMRLWLAPVTVLGKSVWVGQVSRDIGVKFTSKSATLTTHVIDPAVDEAREYVLQSLLTHSAVARFGFVRAMEPSTSEDPNTNLMDDPYFTEGLRLVVLLADEPVSPERARNLHWEEAEGPIAPVQTIVPTTEN